MPKCSERIKHRSVMVWAVEAEKEYLGALLAGLAVEGGDAGSSASERIETLRGLSAALVFFAQTPSRTRQ